MKIRRSFEGGRGRRVSVVAVGVLALVLAGCGGGGGSTGSSSGQTAAGGGGGTLTVDTSFIVKSLDPARNVTPTMTIATRGIYDTLLRATPGEKVPKPSIATSFDATSDAKKYTFHLRDDAKFADGAAITSADVLFSFKRLAALKLGGSYLMDGIAVTAPDAKTIVLTSKNANPAIPAIVATPGFAILNSAMVKQAGGTDADDAADTDKADTWFNSHSAGSGPYLLDSFKTDDSITLVRNEKYWGDDTPTFDRVVIRNMPAATQLLNVQRGSNEIAVDLSATQSASLAGNSKLTVKTDASSSLFRLQMNMDPKASAVSSNPNIQQAVRHAINYDAMVQLGGKGAIQAAGLVQTTLPGSLPADEAVKTDVAKAKTEVAASGIANPSLTITYPSDIDVNGIKFATFAQRAAADLQAVGITAKLQALPVATYLPKWREGTMEMTLTYSYPDVMDPSSFSGFFPGGSDAVRAGWKKGDAPDLEKLSATMASTVDAAKRAELAQQMQRKLNEVGPYVPLIQTAQTIVSTSNLTNVALDPSWTLDVAAIGTK